MGGMQQADDAVSEQVVAVLSEEQGDRTDAAFAEMLGVTRAHWSHLRAGRRKPSYELIKRAADLFPRLYPIVIRDLVGPTVGSER